MLDVHARLQQSQPWVVASVQGDGRENMWAQVHQCECPGRKFSVWQYTSVLSQCSLWMKGTRLLPSERDYESMEGKEIEVFHNCVIYFSDFFVILYYKSQCRFKSCDLGLLLDLELSLGWPEWTSQWRFCSVIHPCRWSCFSRMTQKKLWHYFR